MSYRSHYTVTSHWVLLVQYHDNEGVFNIALTEVENNIIQNHWKDEGIDIVKTYLGKEEWIHHLAKTKLGLKNKEQLVSVKPYCFFHTSSRTEKLVPDSYFRFSEVVKQEFE